MGSKENRRSHGAACRTGKQNRFVSDFVTSITIYLPSLRLQHQCSSKAEFFYFILHIAAQTCFLEKTSKMCFT